MGIFHFAGNAVLACHIDDHAAFGLAPFAERRVGPR